jgi:hypothetical protein
VDPRADLDEIEKRKYLTLPGLELLTTVCFSLNVGDQVSSPYRAIGKLGVTYIMFFCFYTADGSGMNGSK